MYKTIAELITDIQTKTGLKVDELYPLPEESCEWEGILITSTGFIVTRLSVWNGGDGFQVSPIGRAIASQFEELFNK